MGSQLIRRELMCTAMVGAMMFDLGGFGVSGAFAADAPVALSPAHAGHMKMANPKSALGVVSLDVYADGGRLHLLIAERKAAGGAPELQYQRSDDGGGTWSPPVPVGVGQPSPDPAHRGLDAQVAAAGDKLVAVWTTGAETRFGRGPLATSVSSDGGRTWTPGGNPADDGAASDHAFADIAADDAGNFHAVWLDGRERGGEGTSDVVKAIAGDAADAQAVAAAASSASNASGTSGKGLRYARSTDGGRSWSPNVTLDAQCCECCWNSLLTLPGGVVHVLYRDRDPRDMAVISSADGGKTWGKPATVGAFGWAFDGCPHVGGALAASGRDRKSLVATVWTAKGADAVGVFALAMSEAGAASGNAWSTPTQLGGPQSSRPDLAAGPDGVVVATWDAYVDDPEHPGNQAFAASSHDGGQHWETPVRLSEPGASATYPRVVRTGKGFRAFWTQQEPGKPVRWVSHSID